MSVIVHIAARADWESARSSGSYAHASLASEKFIHCSTPDQFLSVANYNFRNSSDLVLLVIDTEKLQAEVRHENLEGGLTLFPHVYGHIAVAAVTDVIAFAPDRDGVFRHDERTLALLASHAAEKPPVIRLRDFNVATIYASDLDASLAFYTGVLGMRRSRAMGRGYLLDAANGQLTVYIEGGRNKDARGGDIPSTALCFQPEGGVRAAYEALRSAGVPFAGEYMELGPDFHMFIASDPDGMPVEFAGKP